MPMRGTSIHVGEGYSQEFEVKVRAVSADDTSRPRV